MLYFALITALKIWFTALSSKPFRSQEVATSCEICRKTFQSKRFLKSDVFLKKFIFLRVAANQRYILQKRKKITIKSLKIFGVAYRFIILFRTHEMDAATEKEFEIVLQMYGNKHVLVQRVRQSAKLAAKENNTNKYAYYKCCKTRKLPLEECFN